MIKRIRSKWQALFYNFRWSDYVWMLNGRLAKLAVGVPLVGYLLLFNDAVSQHLAFDRLAPQRQAFCGLSGTGRLQFLYIGLVALGTANAAYFVFRPFVLRFAESRRDYVNKALEQFTVGQYIEIHGIIRSEGHWTLYGKYYDAEYDEFLRQAGGHQVTGLGADWGTARSRYESLMRGMLMEHFFRYDRTKRLKLTLCLLLATVGYLCLIIPSVDLFIKVLFVILKPVFSALE